MNKILTGLLIISSITFAGMQKDMDYSGFDKIPTVELAKMMANEMAKGVSLPMKLDDATQLTSIYSYRNNIIFRKELNINHPKIEKIWQQQKNEFIQAILKSDSQNICYNSVWKYMIYKKNIIAEFNYIDTDNKPLFNYTIEIEDCNKLK